MEIVTFKASEELVARLELLAKDADRSKSYLVRRAVEAFLEDQEDYSLALERLAGLKEKDLISLEVIERKYGLED